MLAIKKYLGYFDFVNKIIGYIPSSGKLAVVGLMLKAGLSKSFIISILVLL